MTYFLSLSADGVTEAPGADRVRVPMSLDEPTELHVPPAGPPVRWVVIYSSATGGEPVGFAPLTRPLQGGDSIILEGPPIRITES